MYHAYRLRLTFNSGYFARLPFARTLQACRKLRIDVASGVLDAKTIYVVADEEAAHFRKSTSAVCGRLDQPDLRGERRGFAIPRLPCHARRRRSVRPWRRGRRPDLDSEMVGNLRKTLWRGIGSQLRVGLGSEPKASVVRHAVPSPGGIAGRRGDR